MTDRYPLTINSATSQIEEIPAGDNLNLSSSDITNAGNITTVGKSTSSTVQLTGLSSDPAGSPGLIYYNTVTGKFRGYNGIAASWQDLN